MSLSRESKRLLDETNRRPWNAQSAIAQIQSCKFECEGGPLENSDAWRWLVMTYGTREPRTGAGSLD
jgi:hypothetical protein